jgi:ATP-dependent Lhr-like helicase
MATPGQLIIQQWYQQKNWHQFPFQKEMEKAYLNGYSGLLNAPTGSGKTFALFLPFLADFINRHPDYQTRQNNGLQMLWITPLRALTNDIKKAMQEVCDELQIPWKIATRTGDTPAAEKTALKKKLPEVLLTTPESLHLMLAQKEYPKIFQSLQVMVVDEWHELLGTKRGVQVELGLSKLKVVSGEWRVASDFENGKKLKKINTEVISDLSNGTRPSSLATHHSSLKIWGISATIGNLEQAADVLLGNNFPKDKIKMVRANVDKKLVIQSIIPENIESYSWSGHIGLKLLPQVMDIVAKSKTTLIFTNTRSQSEIWYHAILDNYPEYAGIMAMHHGSLDNELRNWVEQALHAEALKVVVCTSSLSRCRFQAGGYRDTSRQP